MKFRNNLKVINFVPKAYYLNEKALNPETNDFVQRA